MRITLVFEQLFILLFQDLGEINLCQYNEERPQVIVPRKDRR